MILKENNVGFVPPAGILSDGEVERLITLESGNVLGTGLLKGIRSGNWQNKADTVQGSFTK
jgi:hypothetical protein